MSFSHCFVEYFSRVAAENPLSDHPTPWLQVSAAESPARHLPGGCRVHPERHPNLPGRLRGALDSGPKITGPIGPGDGGLPSGYVKIISYREFHL